MVAILRALGMFVADLFKPRCRLEAAMQSFSGFVASALC
jgi:hypothetical protein